jgi:hypothetical protein
MFSKNRQITLLGLLFYVLVANQVVQTDQVQMFPKIQKEDEVIEAGSTLTLACVEKLNRPDDQIKWTVPRHVTFKEV